MSEKKENSFSEEMQNYFLSNTFCIGVNDDSILRKRNIHLNLAFSIVVEWKLKKKMMFERGR